MDRYDIYKTDHTNDIIGIKSSEGKWIKFDDFEKSIRELSDWVNNQTIYYYGELTKLGPDFSNNIAEYHFYRGCVCGMLDIKEELKNIQEEIAMNKK